jgi:pimeloyl-ACP methyl ester carboxylesterase
MSKDPRRRRVHDGLRSTKRALRLLIVGALVLFAPNLVAEEPGQLADSAASFVRLFLDGDDAALAERMETRMREAFPPATAGQLRESMLAQHGAVAAIGDAWYEDSVQGYERYRVPVDFAGGELDLRVVFDGEGLVAGFFQAPRLAPPARDAAPAALAIDAPPRPEFEGQWKGAIELPGMELEVQVDLRAEDGEWRASIDIPAQGAKGLDLKLLHLHGDAIRFAIAGVPGDPTFDGTLAEGAIAGEFSQSGQRFPFRLARGALAELSRPQEPQPPFPYRSETLSYDTGAAVLAGTLTLPEGEGPFPAALLLSGSGAQNRDEEVFGHKPFLVLADHLTRAGIAVLRVDDRGTGESTGDMSGATMADFAEDAKAGLAMLQARPEIAADRVGLIGHSEGALVAPMVAADSDLPAFVVMLAGPGVTGDSLLLRQVELIMRADGATDEQLSGIVAQQRELLRLVRKDAEIERIRAQYTELLRAQMSVASGEEPSEEELDAMLALPMSVTSPWFRHFIAFDPSEVLSRVRVPVLALYGEKDLQVDPKQNLPEIRRVLLAAGNEDVTVVELPGLNHLFQKAETGNIDEYYAIEETFDPQALAIVSSWILQRFE